MIENYVLFQTAFTVSFAVIAAIVFLGRRFIPQSGTVLSRFGTFLQTRSFPIFTPHEHNRLAVLRFFFGLIIFLRGVNVASLLLPEEYFLPVGYVTAVELIFSLFIMFGFATQFAIGFFMLFMWFVGESYQETLTLGNDIAAMVALFFLLTEAGRTLSIDGYLVKKFPLIRPVFGYGSQLPGNESIAVAKFVMLFSFWLVCMYSFVMHLNEPGWLNGVTGPMLFVSNYMFRFHSLVEPLFLQSTLAVLAARLSIFFMLVWYVVLLGFVMLGGWWRIAAIIWGILFFLLSAVGLQLGGSLAYFEMVLWIICFWPHWGVDSTKKLLLFYDDTCNLCDRTVQFVRRVDFFDRVQLTPVSKNHELLATYGISVDTALGDLHGVIPGENNVAAGYDLYLLLARHVLVLWLALPLLWLGEILSVGPAIYQFVAARRKAMFGVCILPRPKKEWATAISAQQPPTLLFTMVVWHAIFLGIVYFVTAPVLVVGHKGYNSHPLAQAAQVYGDTHIDVFNHDDLKLMDNWFTLTDVETNTLIPILAQDGSRLALHRSDRVYGNMLRFRRFEIYETGCGFIRWEKSIRYITQVWMYDTGNVGKRKILYTQYYRPHPNHALVSQNIYKKDPLELRCEVTFTSER